MRCVLFDGAIVARWCSDIMRKRLGKSEDQDPGCASDRDVRGKPRVLGTDAGAPPCCGAAQRRDWLSTLSQTSVARPNNRLRAVSDL